MIEFSTLQFIYFFGLQYTIIGGVIISFGFALWRWVQCIKEYIETGDIDKMEGSFFFGENNWFWGPSYKEMKYYNNPWAIAFDIASISVAIALLAVIWPMSVIVISTITYAKVARVRYKRKKEFIDRLTGEHA